MMVPSRAPRPRRGYAMVVVLISLMLLFAWWNFVYRTTSGLLRIETSRLQRQTSDQGAVSAMSKALQLLQYSQPGAGSTYFVTMSLPDTSSIAGNQTSVSYMVVYTALDPDPSTGAPRWSVAVSPVATDSVNPARMLPSGVPVQWP